MLLVEVPMGTTLREIIFDIGGGIKGDKNLKRYKPEVLQVVVFQVNILTLL